MNAGTTLLAVYEPMPGWLNFLAMAFALVLGVLGVLLWAVMIRKKRRRKHRPHHAHRGERKPNPTLAETGGLPPFRPDENPNDQPPLP